METLAEKKARMLNEYCQALKVLKWLDQQKYLNAGLVSVEQLAIWYSVDFKEEETWLKEQIKQD